MFTLPDKTMFWKRVRIFLALVFSLAAWDSTSDGVYDNGSADGYLVPGMFIVASSIFLVIFQLATSFIYDVLTLRRGVWRRPSLADSPWRKGFPFSTSFFALLALFMGIMLLLAAPFQDWRKVILGVACLLVSAILHGGQKFVCKVFAARFP